MRTIQLSKQVLKQLRSPNLKQKNQAIGEVANILGLNIGTPWGWNQTIAWLDQHYPGWRGYPNPTIGNPELLEIVA